MRQALARRLAPRRSENGSLDKSAGVLAASRRPGGVVALRCCLALVALAFHVMVTAK